MEIDGEGVTLAIRLGFEVGSGGGFGDPEKAKYRENARSATMMEAAIIIILIRLAGGMAGSLDISNSSIS